MAVSGRSVYSAFAFCCSRHPGGRRDRSFELVARNYLLDDVFYLNNATKSRGNNLISNKESVIFELYVGICVWLLRPGIHVHACAFKLAGHCGVLLDEALLAVQKNELFSYFRLLGYQVLFCRQITVTLGMRVLI